VVTASPTFAAHGTRSATYTPRFRLVISGCQRKVVIAAQQLCSLPLVQSHTLCFEPSIILQYLYLSLKLRSVSAPDRECPCNRKSVLQLITVSLYMSSKQPFALALLAHRCINRILGIQRER